MTKERLRAYRANSAEVAQLAQRIAELEARMLSPKIQQLTGMPRAGGSTPALEAAVIKRIELLDTYHKQIARIEREELAIEDAIKDLKPEQRMVIRYRYMDRLEWEEVCQRMSYSWRQTHRIHYAALAALEAQEA